MSNANDDSPGMITRARDWVDETLDGVVPEVPVGDWAESGVSWLDSTFGSVFDFISTAFETIDGYLTDALHWVPPLILALIFALIGFLRSWQLGLGTALSMTLIVAMDLWQLAMLTLSFIIIATVIALLIAIPIGILAARNRAVSVIVRPILDFMQTMPGFVYLVPTVTFFSLGLTPGLVATIVFALPPGVRLTELGIRQVDKEVVEAGEAFGATPRQILRGIQLPLARPTIMTGVNQVIMLALSMSVIAGIVAADGLGKRIIESIQQLQVGNAVEAGLGIVILAIFLDRLTSASGAGTISRVRGAINRGNNNASPAAGSDSGSSDQPSTADQVNEVEKAKMPPGRAAGGAVGGR